MDATKRPACAGLGGTGETPARAWRRRTLRGAASSVGQIALLFGLPASLPRLVRRSPDRIRGYRQSLLVARWVISPQTPDKPLDRISGGRQRVAVRCGG